MELELGTWHACTGQTVRGKTCQRRVMRGWCMCPKHSLQHQSRIDQSKAAISPTPTQCLLLSLPPELLMAVYHQLDDLRDVAALMLTCSQLCILGNRDREAITLNCTVEVQLRAKAPPRIDAHICVWTGRATRYGKLHGRFTRWINCNTYPFPDHSWAATTCDYLFGKRHGLFTVLSKDGEITYKAVYHGDIPRLCSWYRTDAETVRDGWFSATLDSIDWMKRLYPTMIRYKAHSPRLLECSLYSDNTLVARGCIKGSMGCQSYWCAPYSRSMSGTEWKVWYSNGHKYKQVRIARDGSVHQTLYV